MSAIKLRENFPIASYRGVKHRYRVKIRWSRAERGRGERIMNVCLGNGVRAFNFAFQRGGDRIKSYSRLIMTVDRDKSVLRVNTV